MPLLHLRRAPSKRSLCAVAALLCFATAFVLTPSDVRSQSAALPEPSAMQPRAVAQAPLRAIAPRRDAFEPQAALDDAVVMPVQTVSMLPSPPPRMPLPLAHVRGDLRISAIAIGDRPSAIVDDAGNTRTIAIGDTLAGVRVRAINAEGIELSDGRRIGLETDR